MAGFVVGAEEGDGGSEAGGGVGVGLAEVVEGVDGGEAGAGSAEGGGGIGEGFEAGEGGLDVGLVEPGGEVGGGEFGGEAALEERVEEGEIGVGCGDHAGTVRVRGGMSIRF